MAVVMTGGRVLDRFLQLVFSEGICDMNCKALVGGRIRAFSQHSNGSFIHISNSISRDHSKIYAIEDTRVYQNNYESTNTVIPKKRLSSE